MSFLSRFKKDKTQERHQKKMDEQKQKAKELATVEVEKKIVKPKAEKAALVKEDKTVKAVDNKILVEGRALRVPHITEKASLLSEQNDYIFKVRSNATKSEIKKEVAKVYGVEVIKVRTINVPKKAKRLGRTRGFKQGYKKAIVRIKKGQSIEILPR